MGVWVSVFRPIFQMGSRSSAVLLIWDWRDSAGAREREREKKYIYNMYITEKKRERELILPALCGGSISSQGF